VAASTKTTKPERSRSAPVQGWDTTLHTSDKRKNRGSRSTQQADPDLSKKARGRLWDHPEPEKPHEQTKTRFPGVTSDACRRTSGKGGAERCPHQHAEGLPSREDCRLTSKTLVLTCQRRMSKKWCSSSTGKDSHRPRAVAFTAHPCHSIPQGPETVLHRCGRLWLLRGSPSEQCRAHEKSPWALQTCVQNSVQSKAALPSSSSHTSTKTLADSEKSHDTAGRPKTRQNKCMGST
jgi:hypothetical protein